MASSTTDVDETSTVPADGPIHHHEATEAQGSGQREFENFLEITEPGSPEGSSRDSLPFNFPGEIIDTRTGDGRQLRNVTPRRGSSKHRTNTGF